MKKQISYLLSTNYAGSHFLSLQLASHSRCISTSELHHFRKDTWHRACHLCPIDDECPVFKGVLNSDPSEFYNKIFENIATFDPQIQTLIDNSKKPRWAKKFLDRPEFEQKYIHLIRDPRALARRWMLTHDSKKQQRKVRITTARHCWKHAPCILTQDEPNVYIWKWLYENQRITNFLQDNNLNFKLITYHDLVFNTDEVLTGLMNWIGYDYEPKQKDYWNFTHHCSVKPEYMKPPADDKKRFDQRWKTFLDGKSQEKILLHPHIQAYIQRMGLYLDPEVGLIRNDKNKKR